MKIKLYILFVSTFLFFTDVKSDEIFTLGKDIFLNSGNCAACHSLKDAGSVTNVGPNLNEIRPELARVEMAVKNGIGVMPSMLGILSEEEIKAVSYYVAESANN
jgi:mono/diheme cytochrome c family protein